MSEIKLKSKLIEPYDPEATDLSEFVVPLTPDTAVAERDWENFLRRFAVKSEASEVAPKDTVTLSCRSENPRFNRAHVDLRIGLGLFSKEIEGAAVGMKKGEERTVTAAGSEVTVTVESIIRETVPKLTDKMAEGCGIPGVRTVKDAYDYCRGKQFSEELEAAADDAAVKINGDLTANSRFLLDEEEAAEANREMAPFLEKLKNIQPEGLENIENIEKLENLGVSMLKSAVLGCAMFEREGALVTTEDYDRSVRARAEAYHISLSEAAKRESEFAYAMNEYSDKFMDAVEEYALRRLIKEGLRMAEEVRTGEGRPDKDGEGR